MAFRLVHLNDYGQKNLRYFQEDGLGEIIEDIYDMNIHSALEWCLYDIAIFQNMFQTFSK